VDYTGSGSQGGLHGGTNHFGPSDSGSVSSSRVYYDQGGLQPGQPALTPAAGPADQPASAEGEPVAITPSRIPDQIWLLLPVGLMLLAAVAYVVFEPADPVADRQRRQPVAVAAKTVRPVPVVSLGGLTLRSAVATGRAFRRIGRWIARRWSERS